jgi:multisubunit Na+/H+ antiporter MnhF subunit
MMSFWVMLDDSINTDELLAGAGAAALAAFFAELVSYQTATRFRMRIEWLVPAFSLPGQVVRDTVIVYHALWRRVAHGEQPPSAFLELPARFGDDRPEGLIPAGIVLYRGELVASVVAYEFITSVAVMVLALLAQGFQRPALFELPVVLAVLLFGSGLVFVRALERWL